LSEAPTTAIDFGRKSASSRIGHGSLSGLETRDYLFHRPSQ
jgi:hypothetical protein